MYYEIKVSDDLYNLAREFAKYGSTLYIVGGYVRDQILGYDNLDIDICSDMPYDKAIDVAKSLNYSANIVNKNLGTIFIKTPNDEYEYVPFRSENYADSGAHSPNSVVFINDIKTDARRRDLAVNAIYYDILGHEILDFYGGLNDLKRGVIHAVDDPKRVFMSDGVRILRLIRFSKCLGYKIDPKTKNIAKSMTYKIKDISKDRICKELQTLVEQKDRYNAKNVIKNAINLINKWHIMDQVLTIGGKHIDCRGIEEASDSNRFDMLLFRIFEPYIIRCRMCEEYFLYNVLGRGGLGVSNARINKINHVIDVLYSDVNKWSAGLYDSLSQDEKEMIELIDNTVAKKFKSTIEYMRSNNLPLGRRELKIEAKDISNMLEDKRQTGYYLDKLMYEVLENNLANDSKILTSTVKKMIDDDKKVAE